MQCQIQKDKYCVFEYLCRESKNAEPRETEYNDDSLGCPLGEMGGKAKSTNSQFEGRVSVGV